MIGRLAQGGTMARRISPILLIASLYAAPTRAADLVVTIRDAHGAPVADAVVTAYPAAPAPTPAQHGAYDMAQKDIRFIPFVLAVPVGTAVRFPNHDRVKHQVYSFSAPKHFTLDLYGHDEQRSVVFDKPGTVALGCNIHDSMLAFIRVVDSGFYAQSGRDGVATIHALPPGPARLLLWHPYLRAPGGEVRLDAAMPASGAATQAVTITLKAPPPRKANY
jgi:plastocyanin